MGIKKIKTITAKDILLGFSDKVYLLGNVGKISEKKVLKAVEIDKSVVLHIENVGVRIFQRGFDTQLNYTDSNNIFTDLNKALEVKKRNIAKIKTNASELITRASILIKQIDDLEKEMLIVDGDEDSMIKLYNEKLRSWADFCRTLNNENESLNSDFRRILN